MTVGERIKYLRKDVLGMTQPEFGKRIGLKKSGLSLIETGNNTASNTVILAICREFNVRREWLENGEGEMRPTLTREAEIAQITATLFKDQKESFRYRLIKALTIMDEDGLKYLEQLAEEVVNIKKD